MKKSITTKIERLLSSLVKSTDSSRFINSENINYRDADNMHYEKNPDRPVKSKLPERLLDLLRPKRNPEFR